MFSTQVCTITSYAEMRRQYEMWARRFNPLYVLKNGMIVNRNTLDKLVSESDFSYSDLIEGWDD